MGTLGIILLVAAGLVLLVLLWGVVTYNGFIRLRNLVQESWRQIDVELHRRHELIPNVIEAVRGYASHERTLFEEVTAARSAASRSGSGPAEQAAREDALSGALGRLFALAEAYPALRASENFAQLQTELSNTEDRIAAGRRFYNANVRAMNTKVETFPANVVAGVFGFRQQEYFETSDAARTAPRVDFS